MKSETNQKIVPCLWFNDNGEEAMGYYLSIFKDSKKGRILRYGAGFPLPEGTLLTGQFWLNGQEFTVLNGGPHFKFTEAVSFEIRCADQAEVDYYWDALTANGGQEGVCSWLKDKYGLSWQVVPSEVLDMFADPDREKAGRAMQSMMTMKKLDLATIRAAFEGKSA